MRNLDTSHKKEESLENPLDQIGAVTNDSKTMAAAVMAGATAHSLDNNNRVGTAAK